jgi:hypothetical protein
LQDEICKQIIEGLPLAPPTSAEVEHEPAR